MFLFTGFEAQSHQGQTDDTDSDPYIPDGFMTLECPPYTDPPPPYSPPKPPQILPGEQPPPYDEISNNNITHADENRNQIRGVNSSSGSGRPVQSNFAAHRRSSTRNNAQIESDVTCQTDPQDRLFEPGHDQGDSSGHLRAPNTLPAYASTDVVEGLGVVISPGSDMVCYSSGWHTWIDAHAGHDRQGVQSEARQQRSPHVGQFNTSFTPNCSRTHAVPTATAFQRFSNIFRRDSWKMKNWRRPVSEYSMSPHYATVPRNEQSPRARVGNAHSQAVVKNVSSRPYSSGFPDTLCLSFDTGQATYTLGAVSPSTSSSNSSEQYEQHNTASITVGSTTTSTTTPGASSSGNSSSPPDRSALHADDFLLSPIHRQQFHDDLCRHLPPLQLSSSDQKNNPAHHDKTCVSSSKSTSTEGTSNSVFASQCTTSSAASLGVPHTSGHSFRDASCTRETTHPATKPVSSHGTPRPILTSSSVAHPRNEPQQSLASFIRSNPVTSSASDNRDHTPTSSNVFLQSFQRSKNPIVLPTSRECPDGLNSSCPQASPQFFSAVQQGNSFANNKETPAVVQSLKDSQGGASREAASKLEVMNLQGRNTEQSVAALDHMVALPQEFQGPCQVIFPFSGNVTPMTSAVLYSTSSSASHISISPLLTAASVCATSSTSPSPSPPTVSAYSLGALRRSQSGASQASMFSVCSETGEKKLKSGDFFENDTRMIPMDSCYPDNHSLSRTRSSHYHEPGAIARSLLPPIDAPGRSMPGTHEEVTLNHPSNFNDPGCPQKITFSSQYPQPGVTLPIENTDAVSLGLVTTAAFPCNSNSTSSQPQSISNSSIFSSCVDILAYPADMLQHEDNWQSNSYNFNSLTDVDKNKAGKDVPLLYEADRMTQSINIPPIPPFITAQSGKLLMPVPDDPGNLAKSGKSHDVLKKLKKKRVKDKNCSGPQCCNISRYPSCSPKHHCVKSSEKSKDGSPVHKSDVAVKEKEVVSLRVARPVDKKHKGHSGMGRQHVRMCDNLNCNKVMSRSTGDTAAVYGNADIYRSVAGEGLASSSAYQHQIYGPWNLQSTSCGCDQTFFPGTVINDLNQPPSCLKADNSSSPSHLVTSGPDGALQGKGDARRKTGHRRQSSTGEKAVHIPSPSRYKSRPKSLAAPDMHANEKRVDVNLPRSVLAPNDFGVAGKGARSGFGHDLNFDDQSGLADLHIQETECGSRRVSVGQDSHIQPAVTSARKLSREGNCETLNITKISNSSSNGYHPGSRSGLSNELSFTSRPALNGSHNKKRQSLPTGIGGSPLPGLQDRTNLCSGVAVRPKPSEESHVNIGQIRGERRLDKPVFVDDCIEATSYV